LGLRVEDRGPEEEEKEMDLGLASKGVTKESKSRRGVWEVKLISGSRVKIAVSGDGV
jgi:hypothetical protein